MDDCCRCVYLLSEGLWDLNGNPFGGIQHSNYTTSSVMQGLDERVNCAKEGGITHIVDK